MNRMSTERDLTVTEIQRFCMHDGPGVRTTVFLKGCPLHCAWCHNPETQKLGPELFFYPNKCIGCRSCAAACPNGVHSFGEKHEIDRTKCVACGLCVEACPTGALEICGTKMSVEEILSVVEKDRAFYGRNGGITLSGGEPLAQKEKTLELLKASRERGLHTVIETCGFADTEILQKAIPLVDLFLWDVKDTENARHELYTGVSNETILRHLSLADAAGAATRLRCILVSGVNTDREHYRRVAELALSLKHCEGVEWIPYHAYGGTKATFFGGEDTGRKEWIPTPEQTGEAKEVLKAAGVNVF